LCGLRFVASFPQNEGQEALRVNLSAPVGQKERITKPDPKQKNQRFKPVANKPADIELVQIMLVANGFDIKVDGKCGSGTIGAIKSFQKSKLQFKTPDGIVDPGEKTWKAGLPKFQAKLKDDEKINAERATITQNNRDVLVDRAELEKSEAETKRKLLARAAMMIGQADSWLDFCADAEKTMQGADGFLQSLTEFTVRWTRKEAEPPYDPLQTAKSEAAVLKAMLSRSDVDWVKVHKQHNKAAVAYNAGIKAFSKFIEARIGGASSIIGKLEVVQDISFTVVEAYVTARIIATGKSPAVAHAAAAASVTAIKSSANQLGEVLAGKQLDWKASGKKVFIDTFLAGIAGGIGGKFSSAFKSKAHLSLAPKLAGMVKNPALKKAADVFCNKLLDTDAMQNMVTTATKEAVATFGSALEKGSWPSQKEFGEAVIKTLSNGLTGIPAVKAFLNLDQKATLYVSDALQTRLIPALSKRIESEMAKKFGRSFLEIWPKIAPEIYEKVNDEVKGKALEIFLLGAFESAAGSEKENQLAKLGEDKLRRDADLHKEIDALIRKKAELRMKEKEKAR